ncbi:LysR substrate-binding domain-containing protein [Steroidobacter flavus]|uniref:LysR substrate-binding domain-containing protein n=1 Tax=Steroidobacter flavus TaxID=1842136 RepID=A0ABV8T445_9GAMM
MNERLNGVGVFVAVVEAGSFAVAAQRLGVTRSAVAKTIARLERRLKVRLFNRTTRKQSLTDDGHAYYERCVRALAELEAAEECFESGRTEPAGKLRVTVPVLFGRHCVAPILRALGERHPELQLEISFNDRVVDLVEEGFDLAVRVGPLSDSSQLVARRLGVQRMGICAAPEYLVRHGRPANASELNGHLRIAYLSAGRAAAWRVYGDDGEELLPQVKIRLGFDDLQAIADAAIAGAGLAWLPCWMMSPEVKAGRLEVVVSGDRLPGTEIHAVWPRMTHLPLKVRVAVDALVSEIPHMLGR